ncbi:MAG: acyl carrier protein [Burkholderiaceae bacterium]|nr:acyl carrier protein [Burkholderiaceae bacterium]
MSTFERLRNVIAATLKVSPSDIGETTRDQDLKQWDSLGHINLLMALEHEFGVYVEVEQFGELNSVPAILAHLKNQGIA